MFRTVEGRTEDCGTASTLTHPFTRLPHNWKLVKRLYLVVRKRRKKKGRKKKKRKKENV